MRATLRIVQPGDAARQHDADVAELGRAEPDVAAADVPVVLAILACGRFDRVQRMLRRPPVAAALPLIAGRYAAWSGDLFTVAGVWKQVRAALDGLGEAAGGSDAVLAAAGFAAVQRLATDLGDPQLAAGLIARERHARARLGDHALDEDAARLAGCLGLGPRPPAARPPQARDAALRVTDFAGHVLGLDPDATRHRLRLRPRLLPGATALVVRDIGCADATLQLELRREVGRISCRIEQDTGAIPLTVILEPVLPARPDAARVDGREADLAARAEGDDLVLPVQLVLDAPRTLVVDLNGEGPPT